MHLQIIELQEVQTDCIKSGGADRGHRADRKSSKDPEKRKPAAAEKAEPEAVSRKPAVAGDCKLIATLIVCTRTPDDDKFWR